jgi:tetratricopeptide (TPR) repeat protein
MMRKLGSLTIAILILGGTTFAQQTKIYPLSDSQYKKDYARYEEIKKEPDVQKRADLWVAFIKDRAVSKILLNVVNEYTACIQPLIDKKDWTKVVAMEEVLIALFPTEKSAQAAIPDDVEEAVKKQWMEEFVKNNLQPSQLFMQKQLLSAYYLSNNMPKAAETAEKLYALTPDKALLPALADINLKMQNYDKYLEYAKPIIAETPMEQAYPTAIQMAKIYFQKQNIGAVLDMFDKIEKAFGDKLPPNVTEDQYKAIKALVYSNKVDLYTKIETAFGDKTPPNVAEAQYNALRVLVYLIKSNEIYEKKDYPKAQELYEKVIKVDPKNDVAYYQIAMCKWKNNDSEGAIEPFAKCVVLNNKLTVQKAQSYLEQIYKARHNESTEGLDGVLAKAKADLGIK